MFEKLAIDLERELITFLHDISTEYWEKEARLVSLELMNESDIDLLVEERDRQIVEEIEVEEQPNYLNQPIIINRETLIERNRGIRGRIPHRNRRLNNRT